MGNETTLVSSGVLSGHDPTTQESPTIPAAPPESDGNGGVQPHISEMIIRMMRRNPLSTSRELRRDCGFSGSYALTLKDFNRFLAYLEEKGMARRNDSRIPLWELIPQSISEDKANAK